LLRQFKQPAVSAADIDKVSLGARPIARQRFQKRHARLNAPEGVGLEIVSRAGLFRREASGVLARVKERQDLRSGHLSTGKEAAGSAMG
jgi:hypothetical protein